MSLSAPKFSMRGMLAAAVFALSLVAASCAPAQQAPATSPAALKARVNAILKQPQDPSDAERAILDEYFNKSFFPTLIDGSPEQLGQLAEQRKVLATQFLNVKGSQAAHDHLLALTMKAVGQNIAIRNYHPAIRYNAVLIIGQLDKEVPKGGPAAPVPYAPATTALVVMLEKSDFNGVPVTSPVKLAALVGLERHVKNGADPTLAERINAAALAIATNQETPVDASPEVHDWMRRLAVRVLVEQQKKGLTAPVYDAVAKLVGSKQVNLDDRCGIAELVKTPMVQGAQGLNPETMALALGRLARDVTAFEAKEARKYQKDIAGDDSSAALAGGGLGGGFGGGFGGRGLGPEGGFSPELGLGPEGGFSGGVPYDPAAAQGPRIEKRRLLDRLKAVADAVDQFGAASTDETKERMSDLSAPVRAALNDAAKTDATQLGVAKSMIALAAEVEELVNEWSPAEPAAEEGDAAAEEEPAGDAEAAPAVDAAAVEPAAAEGAAANEAAPADAASN